MERIEAIFRIHGLQRLRAEIVRLVQFHCAEHARRSSGAVDARYVLCHNGTRRRRIYCVPTPVRSRCVMHCSMSNTTRTSWTPDVLCPRSSCHRPEGRTYQVDSDATHSPMFHQCGRSGLGENVVQRPQSSVHRLCWTFFESEDLTLRFRPSFLYTGPSAEIDISASSGPLAGRWLEAATARSGPSRKWSTPWD